MRVSHVMSLGLICLANASSAQTLNVDGYRKGKFILHIDKAPKKKVEHVTFLFGSGSANDSIRLFVNKRWFQTILPAPIYQESDLLKSAAGVQVVGKHKTVKITAISVRQKQYISLVIDQRYQLIRIDFYPASSFVTKTNRTLVIE